MKHVLNVLLILVAIINPLVSSQASASAPKAQSAAAAASQSRLDAAYPAPATPTPMPTATQVTPTPTSQPTAVPTSTPTATATPKPPKKPQSEVTLPPGLAKKVEKSGGEITGLDGRLKMTFPADALAEDADVWVVPVDEADLPPTTLSGHPFHIVAKGQSSKQSIRKFAKTATIELSYDPQTWSGSESYLMLYYYNESSEQWDPLPSRVDTQRHVLIATTDHLTILDVDAKNWEALRLPGVKEWQVSNFTGAATYRYPLQLPEGPGGLKPSLTLSYNSQAVDAATLETQAGWVGMGWSLDTGYIRRNMNSTPDDVNDDTFNLVIGGMEHVLLPGNDGFYHTADETFWRIQMNGSNLASNSTWTAWDKTGTTYLFEDQVVYPIFFGSQEAHPVWRWSITKIRNAFGRELTYTYYPHEEERKNLVFGIQCGSGTVADPYRECIFWMDTAVYPKTITYPNNRYQIVFELSGRNDYGEFWELQNSARMFFERRKLQAVNIKLDGVSIRKYEFVYAAAGAAHIFNGYTWNKGDKTLTLSQVKEYGLNGVGPLPATTFTYDANNLHLQEADNGQGGKITFSYERVRVTENLPRADIDDHLAPFPLVWAEAPGDITGDVVRTMGNERVRPGGSYRLVGKFNAGQSTRQVRFKKQGVDLLVLTAASGATTVEGIVDLPGDVGYGDVAVVMSCPAGCTGASFYVEPLLTRYRVTQKQLSAGLGNPAQVYTYSYSGVATNDPTHSAIVATTNNYCTDSNHDNDLCYSPAYTEFRGHSSVTETGPDGRAATTWFHQDDERVGQAYRTEIRKGGSLYQSNETLYTSTSTNNLETVYPKKNGVDYAMVPIHWVAVTWQKSFSYEGGSVAVGKMVENTYDPGQQGFQKQYGNVTHAEEWQLVNGTFVPYRISWWAYRAITDATHYQVSLPIEAKQFHCPGGVCNVFDNTRLIANTQYLYDGRSAYTAQPTEGRLTGERRLLYWVNGNTTDPRYADVDYAYDDWGNRVSVTQYTQEGTPTARATGGAQKSVTCYGVGNVSDGCAEDGYYTYPLWQKNFLSATTYHQTSYTYNYAWGLPKQVTDPNEVITWADYDGYGRLWKIARPGDDLNGPTIEITYHDTTPFWTQATQKLDGGLTLSVRKFYNGLGELIQTQQVGAILNDPACSGTCTIVTNQKSEYAGGVKKTSQTMPTPMNSDPLGYIPQPASPWTNATVTSYDVLDRPLTVSAPDQTVSSFSYGLDGLLQKTTATDSENRSTHSWKDAWGRTVKVQPPTGPWLEYEYDAADRLTVVEQFPSGSSTAFATTTISYDVAGRKTQMIDPDMGTWVYTYDAVGNMVTQRDAKLQSVWFGYDALNRPIEKRASNASGTLLASYSYDQGSYGIGRRSAMSAGSTQTAWSYDARGRVTQQSDVIPGLGSYATAWSYNSADRVTSMTYPSGEVVNYTYLPQGGVSQVDSMGEFYLNGASYDASGRARERLLGNGVKNTWSYNAWNLDNKGGRLNAALAYKTSTPTTYLQNLAYINYDKVGNLTALSDYAANESLTFSYDALNRLDLVSGAYSDNPEYDARGNLSQKKKLDGTLLSLSYPTGTAPARPHAALSVGSNTFQYDANGSMTARVVNGVSYTLTYDVQNRLTAISGGGLSASYTYNADGARIKAVVTNGGVTRTTGYVGDYFEISLGQPKASQPGAPRNCTLPTRCIFVPRLITSTNLAPGQAWYSYYYAGTSRIALRIKSNQLNLNDGVFYFLSDHLGGTAITLDANGVKTGELRYTAWGETRYTSGSTPTQRRYTGQLEAEAGLYFYNARWYDPALGRFAQADPIVPIVTQGTQAWDRYAYLRHEVATSIVGPEKTTGADLPFHRQYPTGTWETGNGLL
jgi:RHS repeat-associated protein